MKLKYTLTLAVCALLVGCTTMFTSIVTVTEVVDSAMKNWAHLSATGQTTVAFDAKVVQAHDAYRKAAATAQIALQTYKRTNDAKDFATALSAARDGALPLIDLIASILNPTAGVKLQNQLTKASQP